MFFIYYNRMGYSYYLCWKLKLITVNDNVRVEFIQTSIELYTR
jgi:hypothetical protein